MISNMIQSLIWMRAAHRRARTVRMWFQRHARDWLTRRAAQKKRKIKRSGVHREADGNRLRETIDNGDHVCDGAHTRHVRCVCVASCRPCCVQASVVDDGEGVEGSGPAWMGASFTWPLLATWPRGASRFPILFAYLPRKQWPRLYKGPTRRIGVTRQLACAIYSAARWSRCWLRLTFSYPCETI